MRSIRRWGGALGGAALLLVLAGCQSAPWYDGLAIEPAPLAAINNTSRFGDAVYFGAQPSEGDFPFLAQMGIRTVINLRTEEEMAEVGFDEEAAAYKAGLNYLNIPVGREEPGNATLELINSIIDDKNRRPVFIHCASSNRVGYVWAVYRGMRDGLPPEAALTEGREVGMRSPVLEGWARQRISGNETP